MALALISSLLLVLASPPHDLWPLAWVSLVPLLLALPGTSPREALLLGALTGTATVFVGFHWVLELMHRFSKLGPAAYLVMLVMAMYQSLPFGLWCFFLRAPGPKGGGSVQRAGGMLLSAATFVALEFFHPVIFPWYLANSQHTFPVATSVVSLGGVSLLSLAIVVVNLCLARLLAGDLSEQRTTLWPLPLPGRFPRSLLATAVAVPALLLGYHLAVKSSIEQAMAAAPKLGVGLVQPNEWIGQGPSINGLHDYQTMTEALVRDCKSKGLSLDLVIWPESAVRTPPTTLIRQPAGAAQPVVVEGQENFQSRAPLARYPLDVAAIFPSASAPAASLEMEVGVGVEELFAVQRGHNVPILFGTTLEDVSPGAKGPIEGRAPLYNCGVLVDGGGKVLGAVKKVKLLMFGETIPGSGLYPDIYKLLPSASALLSGKEPEVISMGAARLGIMICYEDLLPWFHYQLAQKKPQILLNLTNDAWFGKSEEPACHLDLAAMRAVEGRCYLIRSTPTGISAVVDPFGRLVAQIPSDQAGTLREEVGLLDIATGFEKFGDSAAWLALAYVIGFGSWWWASGRKASRL